MNQKSNSLLIILLIALTSCSLKNKENDEVSYHFKKIEYFVEKYDCKKDDSLFFKGKLYKFNDEKLNLENKKDSVKYYSSKKVHPYFVDDSLKFHLSKLDSLSLKSDFIKSQMGKLLEKKYLHIRKNSNNSKHFSVYNVSIWAIRRESTFMALKIMNNFKVNDFVCIDSIVLKLDKIKYSQNEINHINCMKLILSSDTGGCVW